MSSAEEALRNAEERCRLIIDGALDYAILTLDPTGVIESWSPGARAAFQWQADDIVGQSFTVTFTPKDRAKGIPLLELEVARKHGVAPDVRWHMRKDGSLVFIEGTTRSLKHDDGTLRGYLKIGQDVTQRRQVDESLRASEVAYLKLVEDTRDYASERTRLEAERNTLRQLLSGAEEAERRRLARELHDQLGQHLTAFSLGLAEARHLIEQGQPVDTRLSALEGLAHLMTRDARYLALELRPPELDDMGLVSALQTYLDEWSSRYNVTADFAFTGDSNNAIPDTVGTAIYRIAQEALTNVAKHAEADSVSVILELLEQEVRLIVEDNGTGFEAEATFARARAERRLGLGGMSERAALVDGTVTVESTPGAGTTIFVRLPMIVVPPA